MHKVKLLVGTFFSPELRRAKLLQVDYISRAGVGVRVILVRFCGGEFCLCQMSRLIIMVEPHGGHMTFPECRTTTL